MMCSLAVADIIFPLYSLYRYVEVFTHERMCPTSHAHTLYLPSVVFVPWQRLVTWLLSVEIAIWQSEDLCGIVITWKYLVLLRQYACLPWLISVVYAVLTYFSKRLSRVYTPMAAVFLLVLFPFYLPVITFCYLSSYCRKIFKREIETTHFWKGKKND